MVGLGRLELPTSPLSVRGAVPYKVYSKAIFKRMEYLSPTLPRFLLKA